MMPVVPPLLELQNSHSAPGSTAFATPGGPANGGLPETSRVARTSSAMLSFHRPQLAEASNALHPLQQSYRLLVINSAREDPSLFRGWDESAAALTFWTHPLARPIGLTLMRISDTLVPSYIDNGRVFQ